ncbi:hypothetical protein [Pseudoalteromonas sp. P1-8]|uniref:hypothetical protein n=1 Tax=Pseudoalteromonas sp. P1-8 TaxID=1710353 RepID=UPI000AD724D8|nr:hypothetical protein [Pseudoalteromonas sp. P1-8]
MAKPNKDPISKDKIGRRKNTAKTTTNTGGSKLNAEGSCIIFFTQLSNTRLLREIKSLLTQLTALREHTFMDPLGKVPALAGARQYRGYTAFVLPKTSQEKIILNINLVNNNFYWSDNYFTLINNVTFY